MEELSGFSTLLCFSLVMRLELEAVLDAVVGPSSLPFVDVQLLGRGVGHAFGLRGGLSIRRDDGVDATEEARARWPAGPVAFDRWLADAELEFERRILAGPNDDEVPNLQALGWDPTTARRGQERRAQQERELSQRLDTNPRWRRGRLRDVVSARYVAIELMHFLLESLSARNKSIDDIWANPESARRIIDSMPSGDVFVTLTTGAHRNGQTSWTPNDMFDIDALSVAVAYCDVVATERHRHHALHASRVPRRLGTAVLATPDELREVCRASQA